MISRIYWRSMENVCLTLASQKQPSIRMKSCMKFCDGRHSVLTCKQKRTVQLICSMKDSPVFILRSYLQLNRTNHSVHSSMAKRDEEKPPWLSLSVTNYVRCTKSSSPLQRPLLLLNFTQAAGQLIQHSRYFDQRCYRRLD